MDNAFGVSHKGVSLDYKAPKLVPPPVNKHLSIDLLPGEAEFLGASDP